MKSYNIAVVPGDGTGPEVVREGVKVLDVACEKYNVTLNYQYYDFGGERYKKTGETLPDSAVDELRKFDAIFLGCIGDADKVANDPANSLLKKYEPKDPMRPPSGGNPYPIPLNQDQWQDIVNRIISDRGLPYPITVAYDVLSVKI